jgi:hypothetical protein
MRRLIDYLNSLLLGVILGMIFVAIVHPSTPRHEGSDANGILISYQVLGTNQQKTVLLIAGRIMQLTDWPHGYCSRRVDRDYRLSSPIIALSISPLRPARLQPACSR